MFHIVLHCLLVCIYEIIHDICLVVYDYVKSRIYFVLLVFSTHAFMCLLSVTRIYRLNLFLLGNVFVMGYFCNFEHFVQFVFCHELSKGELVGF